MKRTMIIEIKNCFDCNQLKTHDGFASHQFECPHLNKWSKQVDDPKSQKDVIKELDGWFNACPKWNLTTASTGQPDEPREEKMDGFLREIISEPIKKDNNSDTVSIRFKDGGINDKATLPDISYEHFLKFMFHSGDSDTEYFKYLREHNMKELTDFNDGGIEDLYLVVEDGFRQRRIVFKAVYDSDKEET